MNVALVRGPYLRPNGILPWEKLHIDNSDITITAFESDPPRFDTSDLQLPVERLTWLDGQFDAFGYDHVVDKGLAHLGLPHTVLTGIRRLARDYDVVHTSENFTFFSLQAALTARRHDATFVFSAGENIPHFPGNSLTWQVKKFVNRAAAGATTTTQFGKRALIHEGVDHSDITVVPNAMDFGHFDSKTAHAADIDLPAEFDDTFNILFVHKLCEQKGVEYLLDAAEELAADHPDLRLIVVGSNQFDDDYYDRRVANAAHVHHVEYLENERISTLYNLADVFTLPSVTMEWNQEQFGMAVLESMACGVPSIVTNVGGLPYVASAGETSLVVDERDADALSGAIERLYTDDALRERLGEASYRYVRDRFTTERVAESLHDFYGSL